MKTIPRRKRNVPMPEVGSRVRHSIFGLGTVVIHRADCMPFHIYFDKHGLRSFMWALSHKNIRIINRKPTAKKGKKP